ncbi:MAG: M1 family aminopeptidase, partial [Xanthomonadales bacterium]|nr:M1 family aminopeptidase [Xanthomonadales bacterium]
MKMLRLCHALTLILLIGLLAACQSEDSGTVIEQDSSPVTSRAAIDSLDQATAKARQARVANIEYAIDISLDQGSDKFSGEVSIRFDLAGSLDESGTIADLTLDFGGGELLSSTLNGSDAEIPYNGFFLTLPAAGLKYGSNELTLRFTQNYGHDGTGLHRFVDPVDDRTYLYSYLWPYYANRIFPSFDQPNLKARFTLSVQAPKDWIVVSTSSGMAETQSTDGMTRWQFEITPLIATYAFSLHAGPYKVWEADANGIPMRLMARQSLAEFVAVEEWFDVSRRGLAYYRDYFDIPYPFGKYDQLIVADFAIGAMENIAAVTFKEGYVQRQTSDRTQREQRASTILHEMAHMWFGNLVTHEWWNGMWLNESFATQMAAMAELTTTEFDDSWHGFFTDDKQKAYLADSRVTTHPVEMPVNSTIDFFQVFDAITYQKGASVLKQLAHYVGEENYRRGVSAYLKANSYGNTELEDFVAFQSQTSGKDISAWADEWLYQPGYNTLAAKPQCEGNSLQSLSIEQTASAAFKTLRH